MIAAAHVTFTADAPADTVASAEARLQTGAAKAYLSGGCLLGVCARG